MTTKKNASVAGKSLTNPNSSRADKTAAASALTQRPQSNSYSVVTSKSGQIISRTVTTHRDALKRLADR